MSLLWMAPVALTVLACALLWRWQKTIEAETSRLRQELQTLPVLAARVRALRRQSERTGAATDSAADVFGSHLRK